RDFHVRDVRDARLVFAATDDAKVNAAVAAAAREAGALVNLADDPAASDFVTPAVHRSGPLVVAVNAGGVPGAAARIRDAIAVRFGEGYATALERLGEIRARYLADADRKGWQSASSVLIGEDFCEAVESGRFER